MFPFDDDLIIEPTSAVSSAIIWLHGLGADAHDFAGIVPMLPIEDCGIRMIFPNAPKRPVTINGGYVMPAWYDISDVSLRNSDRAGIAESAERVCALIDAQVELGVPSERIVIAGFSQGGAMALHAALRYPQRLAGIIALSCYVLERDAHADEVSDVNRSTPIWMAHGSADQVVAYELGQSSADFLREAGHDVQFVSYPMAHEVSMPEIGAISEQLRVLLK